MTDDMGSDGDQLSLLMADGGGIPLPDNVVVFPGVTTVDLPCEQVLAKALEKSATFESVVVLVQQEDNSVTFFSSTSDIPLMNILADALKKHLLENAFA